MKITKGLEFDLPIKTTFITYKDGFIQIVIQRWVYELERLNELTKRIIVEGHFTERSFPFLIKSCFSKLGSIVAIRGENQ